MTRKAIQTIIGLTLAVLLALIHSVGIKESAAAAVMRMEGANRIVDQAGRTLVVHRPFERIISLYGAHTENLFDLGLDDEIIGVSRHETYPPRALEKPVYSYREDPEKFLAARPDLVIIRPMIDRGYPQFVSRLEKNGITVLSFQPPNVEAMFTYWQILGLLCGRQQRAAMMISQFETAVSGFISLTEGQAARKRVYFEAIHSKMKTFSPDSMAVFALETAGGINVAADAKPVRNTNIAYYGKERLLSRGREIDVYLAQSGAMNKPTVKLILNEPGFQTIKAVAEGQIYIIDEQIVSRPTMRLLAGIYNIGRILYPVDFSHKNLTTFYHGTAEVRKMGGRH
jgi:iron complex transport system substrate-binding protein